MKKLLILLLVLFAAGCMRVRTYTVEKPRVDTEVEGNQGYLFGQPPDKPRRESRLGSTRRVSVVELEFGPEEKEVEIIRPAREREFEDIKEVRIDPREVAPREPEIKAPVRPPHGYEYESYVVREDDTLQKISRKFYGTTRRWYFLYEENRDVLENPDKIYPGMEIKIPVLR